MQRKTIIIIFLMLICMFNLGWGEQAFAEKGRSSWSKSEFIAHALGGIEGASYTNSYDAFMDNYNRGYRIFEVDLILTSDGQLAARHDWSRKLQPDLSRPSRHTLTLSQFKSSPYLGKYQPLALSDIIKLMQQYPDFYLVTDTKETNVGKVQKQFEYLVEQVAAVDASLLQRIMPEIYSPEMYDTVMKIYPFPNKIYSLYQSLSPSRDILAFVEGKNFSFVAMPVYRALLSPTLAHQLNGIGLRSYVHTVDNLFMMKGLRSIGVYGFYTDAEAAPSALMDQLVKPMKPGILQYLFVLMCSMILLYCRKNELRPALVEGP
jgi:glycerophosphoryl diester phosphodiesterase